MNFLWGKDTKIFRLLIRGREYEIHPDMDKMKKLHDHYMDIDAMYDDHAGLSWCINPKPFSSEKS